MAERKQTPVNWTQCTGRKLQREPEKIALRCPKNRDRPAERERCQRPWHRPPPVLHLARTHQPPRKSTECVLFSMQSARPCATLGARSVPRPQLFPSHGGSSHENP